MLELGVDKGCGEQYTCQATLIFRTRHSHAVPNIRMYGRVQREDLLEDQRKGGWTR